MPEVSTPPVLRGSTEDKVSSVRTYLFMLAEELNAALMAIESDRIEVTKTINGKADRSTQEQEMQSARTQAQTLKALILNTQDVVQTIIENPAQTLADMSGTYAAISQYGTYLDNLSSNVYVTRAGLSTDVEATEVIRSLQTDLGAAEDSLAAVQTDIDSLTDGQTSIGTTVNALGTDLSATNASLHEFRTQISGSIHTGIVDVGLGDEVGIAIGQNITEQEISGGTQKRLQINSYASVFTATRLAFYHQGTMVAYIDSTEGSGVLFISRAKVLHELILGDKWSVSHDNGLAFKWIGG